MVEPGKGKVSLELAKEIGVRAGGGVRVARRIATLRAEYHAGNVDQTGKKQRLRAARTSAALAIHLQMRRSQVARSEE